MADANGQGGNVDTSLLKSGGIPLTLGANFFQAGRGFQLKNRSVLSGETGKDATMKIWINDDAFISTITYQANMTEVYAEIDLEIRCIEIGERGATLSLMGRTLFGAGVSRSNTAIRYLIGEFTEVDITSPITFDLTFAWGDDDPSAANVVVSKTSIIDPLF